MLTADDDEVKWGGHLWNLLKGELNLRTKQTG